MSEEKPFGFEDDWYLFSFINLIQRQLYRLVHCKRSLKDACLDRQLRNLKESGRSAYGANGDSRCYEAT